MARSIVTVLRGLSANPISWVIVLATAGIVLNVIRFGPLESFQAVRTMVLVVLSLAVVVTWIGCGAVRLMRWLLVPWAWIASLLGLLLFTDIILPVIATVLLPDTKAEVPILLLELVMKAVVFPTCSAVLGVYLLNLGIRKPRKTMLILAAALPLGLLWLSCTHPSWLMHRIGIQWEPTVVQAR